MSTMASAEDTWLTISEAAKELDIHPRTLRRYINDERLAVMRLSPQVVRVRPEDIAAFRDREVKIKTGTGTCYVPRPEDEVEAPVEVVTPTVRPKPTPAAPPQPTLGSF